MADDVEVVAVSHPFRLTREERRLAPGATLADIVALARVPKDMSARVFIERNGEVYGPIPRKQWARIRPREGSRVTIRAVAGKQDDNKTLRIILIVVIILIVLILIYFFPYGAYYWITIGAAAIMAVNMLLPYGTPKVGSLARIEPSWERETPTYSVAGARNKAELYKPIPVVYGQHRIFPPFGAVPYTELVGNDQYLRQLFVIGHGQLSLSDLRIGDTPIANFQGVETEIREGTATDEPLTLYTDDVNEEPLSVALTYAGGSQTRTGGQVADEVSVDIGFLQGLCVFASNGGTVPLQVQITVEYRKVGDTEWIKPPGSPMVIADNRLGQVRHGLRWTGHQQVRPTSDITVGSWTTSPLWSKLDEQVASDADFIQSGLDPANQMCEVRCGSLSDPACTKEHLVRYRIGKDTTGGKVIDFTVALYQSTTSIATWTHSNVDVFATYTQTLTEAQAKAITDYTNLRLRFTANVGSGTGSRRGVVSWAELDFPRPAATYEVRLTRDTQDYSTADVKDDSTWTALRTIRKTAPITKSGLCMVALRIKATDQLNGVVDRFNCLAQAILPDWDNGSQQWVTRATSNPAAAYRAALQGKGNARPVADARIHLASLQQWAVDAAAAGMQYNQVVDFRHTVFEQLRDISANCRAAFTMIDGKFGVIQDKAQSSPVQHFTPKNTINFHGRKSFLDMPHALKVRFINPNADWQWDERIVYDDGYDAGTASKYEVVETLGVTSADQAWRIGRYHLAALRLRPEMYEFSVDVENLICTRGDRCQLNHDVLLVGLAAGRIVSVQTSGSTCTGITLDEACPMQAGPSYGVRMRYADGSSVVKSIVANPGEQTVLTFVAPFAAPYPAVGDLVLFGEAGLESIPVIIKEIRHDRDFLARVIALPYDEAIYNADQGTIPPFNSNITLPPKLNQNPPLPVIEGVTSDETVMVRDLDGSLAAQILLSVRYTPTSAVLADWVEVQYRYSDSTSGYIALPNITRLATSIFIRPVQEGQAYDMRVRTVSGGGAVSDWATALNHTVIGKTSLPSAPTGLTLSLAGVLSWTLSPTPIDLAGFIIKRIPGANAIWDQGLTLHDGVHSSSNFATLPLMFGQWTLMVRTVDTSGNESATAGSLTHDFGTALLHNAVETRDEKVQGFPGTKVNCTVQGGTGFLIADQVTTGFWSQDNALFWTSNGNLFWVGTYKQMTYTWTYTTGSSAGDTSLLLDIGAQGNWKAEYKKSADSTWLPVNGVVPGILASTSYDIRITIDAGAVQGIISKLILYLDAPDIQELIQNFAVAVTTGTRLTLTKTYRALKTVSPTVVTSGGETAISAKADDKQAQSGANNGPLIKALDANGAVVAGHVDVILQGY